MVRVWIVAPLAVLGAVAAGWLIYRLVVDRLVDDASDAIKTTLAILTLVGAVLAACMPTASSASPRAMPTAPTPTSEGAGEEFELDAGGLELV
jgi:branched-subunit amino acid ABC-type transport system permease component